MIQVDGWASRNRIASPVEHVFEEGDIGRDELDKSAQRQGCIAHFRPGKKDRLTKDGNVIPAFAPLQAADFLAGEYFMEAERRLRKIERRPKPRWGYLQFDEMQGVIEHSPCNKVAEFRRMLEIAKVSDIYLKGPR